jgi:hypothetical protein
VSAAGEKNISFFQKATIVIWLFGENEFFYYTSHRMYRFWSIVPKVNLFLKPSIANLVCCEHVSTSKNKAKLNINTGWKLIYSLLTLSRFNVREKSAVEDQDDNEIALCPISKNYSKKHRRRIDPICTWISTNQKIRWGNLFILNLNWTYLLSKYLILKKQLVFRLFTKYSASFWYWFNVEDCILHLVSSLYNHALKLLRT